MTLEEASGIWTAQLVPRQNDSRRSDMIQRHIKKTKRQVPFTIAVVALLSVLGTLNFYTQYFLKGHGLLATSLGASVCLAGMFVQLTYLRAAIKLTRERLGLSLSQRDWLARRIAELEEKLSVREMWKTAIFFAFCAGAIATAKWLDYRSGSGSPTESIGILIVLFVTMFAVVLILWHQRKTILIPEYRKYRQMIEELDHDA